MSLPLKTMENALVLGYWDIRGLAAPVRLACAFAKAPLKEEVFTGSIEDGKFSNNWGPTYQAMKAEHPFPNLPYLRLPEGGVLVQSGAILRYVARRLDLYGASPLEQARVDEMLEQLCDMRTEATQNYYSAISSTFLEKSLPYHFGCYERYLKNASKAFLCTDQPTVADFVAYEVLRTAVPLVPRFAEDFPSVANFLTKIEGLPQLADYFSSHSHTLPANNKMAVFGNV